MRVVEQFIVTAPARIVWSTLQDVVDWPKWTSTVSRIEALDSMGLRMGARYRVHQPTLRPTVYVVSALRQGEAFAWTTRMPGATMIASHRISSSGDTSQVELSFEISGWLAKILAWRYGSLISQYVATEARSLKKWCEATHPH
jgi:uncharacterized membrane protein